jgi:hypothetical protein
MLYDNGSENPQAHENMKPTAIRIAVFFCMAFTSLPGHGQGKSHTDLAKATQNLLASMISRPFQNDINFGIGPGDDTQNILNIQPVWPCGRSRASQYRLGLMMTCGGNYLFNRGLRKAINYYMLRRLFLFAQ